MSFNQVLLKDYYKRQLISILDSVQGKKGLVIDPTVSGPLSLVVDFNLLKDHGVEKIYHLADGRVEPECKSLIYVTRPTIENVRWVANQIKYTANVEHTIHFVPRKTLICDRLLEEEGVYGDVTIGEFHLDIIPLDDDLLSLEMGTSFKDLFLDGDTSVIQMLSNAIMKYQILYGFGPKILGKGDASKMLAELLERSRLNYLSDIALNSNTETQETDLDSILLFDRTVDLLTPMRTQLTYEGLIDELYTINSTFVELDASFFSNQNNSKTKRLLLNGTDSVFSDIRDSSFEMIATIFDKITSSIQKDVESLQQMPVQMNLKDFKGIAVKVDAQKQSLATHQKLYQKILYHAAQPSTSIRWALEDSICSRTVDNSFLEVIEDIILSGAPVESPLKLMCLYSLAHGGVKEKIYDQWKRDIFQAYGAKQIFTLQALEKVGLLKPIGNVKSTYSQLSKSLKLINHYESSLNPVDISYTYGGFAPISIRLIQSATKTLPASSITNRQVSWKGFEDVLQLLPGSSFEKSVIPSESKTFKTNKRPNQVPYTLVVFIGGCTTAEISALRVLSNTTHRKFIILTTSVITGNRLINSLAI
ncbi:Sec1-like protein [Globomyces pollinis-pini]|nr:Sec1-like protein [Globomyces pollinis-pini]